MRENSRRESSEAVDHTILHRNSVRIQPWGRFFSRFPMGKVVFNVFRMIVSPTALVAMGYTIASSLFVSEPEAVAGPAAALKWRSLSHRLRFSGKKFHHYWGFRRACRDTPLKCGKSSPFYLRKKTERHSR